MKRKTGPSEKLLHVAMNTTYWGTRLSFHQTCCTACAPERRGVDGPVRVLMRQGMRKNARFVRSKTALRRCTRPHLDNLSRAQRKERLSSASMRYCGDVRRQPFEEDALRAQPLRRLPCARKTHAYLRSCQAREQAPGAPRQHAKQTTSLAKVFSSLLLGASLAFGGSNERLQAVCAQRR